MSALGLRVAALVEAAGLDTPEAIAARGARLREYERRGRGLGTPLDLTPEQRRERKRATDRRSAARRRAAREEDAA